MTKYTIMQLDNAKARLEGMRKCGEYDNCQAIDIALVGLEELAKVQSTPVIRTPISFEESSLSNRGHFCPECEEEAHHMLDRFGDVSPDELKCSACGLIFKEVK